jgi:putative addiction module component (TIGR02574 family)
MITHFETLLSLPKNERLKVAEMLWLSVADEKTLPLSAEHKRIIDERLQRYRSGQSEPIPHATMMKRLRKK